MRLKCLWQGLPCSLHLDTYLHDPVEGVDWGRLILRYMGREEPYNEEEYSTEQYSMIREMLVRDGFEILEVEE